MLMAAKKISVSSNSLRPGFIQLHPYASFLALITIFLTIGLIISVYMSSGKEEQDLSQMRNIGKSELLEYCHGEQVKRNLQLDCDEMSFTEPKALPDSSRYSMSGTVLNISNELVWFGEARFELPDLLVEVNLTSLDPETKEYKSETVGPKEHQKNSSLDK